MFEKNGTKNKYWVLGQVYIYKDNKRWKFNVKQGIEMHWHIHQSPEDNIS